MIDTAPPHRATAVALGLALAALSATGCNPTPSRTSAAEPARRDPPMPPQIQCTVTPTSDGRTTVRYEIRNPGADVLYLLDGRHMPYRLAVGSDTLEILHGVNPPDPNKLYNMIEIPLTRPFAPGEHVTGEVVLPAPTLRDHYGEQPTPDRLLRGTIQVRCTVGWGTTPIAAADRARMSIQQLLAWQQLTSFGPISVTLP
jgi:hypothetical protein